VPDSHDPGKIEASEPLTPSLDFVRAAFLQPSKRSEIRNPHIESPVSAATKKGAKASSVLILLTREEHPLVMLNKRGSNIRFGGHLCFPGGRAEPGESVVETAIRESEEEIGLPRSEVELLGSFGHYYSQAGYRIDPVVGIVQPQFEYVPDPSEVASIHWISLKDMLDPACYQFKWMREGRGYFGYDNDEIHVGGPTVSLMIGLLEWLALSEQKLL
jgi:8-oxo-dGTP pyrophosphatase MutT (NUDIX family)